MGSLTLAGILCQTKTATAQAFISHICLDDLLVLEPGFPKKIIPVGCEVIDCCTGCPGPWIDWRIRVESPIDVQLVLTFENMPKENLSNIKTKGNVNWDKDKTLTIGRGESFIGSLTKNDMKKTPLAFPKLTMDKQEQQRMMDSDKDSGNDKEKEYDVTLTIEQLMGDIPVGSYTARWIIRKCFHGPIGTVNDKIDLDNNTANDNAVVLLDGHRAACVNDESSHRGNDKINEGNILSNAGCRSEVAVFSDDNQMELRENVTAWTDAAGDLLPIPLRPILVVPVQVWLRMGGAATLARAQADIANANLLYNTNNAGISFNATFTDVSANAAAGAVITNGFSCQAAENTALTGSAFFTPGRINVYYVDRAFTGFNCTAVRNIMFIGTTSNNQSLAHEIGHSFSLSHTNIDGTVNPQAGFSAQNLMIGGGAMRTNITEGQEFRMNVNATSTLNTNGVRTDATRNCPDATSSDQCPNLSLDIAPN